MQRIERGMPPNTLVPSPWYMMRSKWTTAAVVMAYRQEWEWLKRIVEMGADPLQPTHTDAAPGRVPDELGPTNALHEASWVDNGAMVRYILRNTGVEKPFYCPFNDCSAVQCCLLRGHREMAEVMISEGADCEDPTIDEDMLLESDYARGVLSLRNSMRMEETCVHLRRSIPGAVLSIIIGYLHRPDLAPHGTCA